MAKNNKISRRRDHNVKTVELHLDRKYSRQTDLRTHPLDEPFYSNRGEGIDTAPQVGVVTIPLTNEGTIYQAGLYHQDGNHSNLGGFRAGVGKDGGDVYRVTADKQGLHKSFATTLFLNDEGTFSVWVKGFNGGAAFDLNYEYVLCVHQVNEQATPEDVDSLVIRWELAQEELRLYPDITNNANVYVAIPLTEAQWQDENWHKISASWSYQNNNWTLKWDDGSGILNAPGFPAQVNHPDWDFSTIVEIFTNRVFEEHIGHDVQFLTFGFRSDTTLDDAYKNSPSGNKFIIINDGPIKLDTADETVILIDSDIAVSANGNLDDKFQWQENIVVADNNYLGIGQISTDADITSDFSALGGTRTAGYDYKWVDLDLSIIGGDAGSRVTSLVNIIDINITLSGIETAILDTASNFLNFKLGGTSKFKVRGDGSLHITGGIYNVANTDTGILIGATDFVKIIAGGIDGLYVNTTGAQDEVVVNEGGVDIDSRFESLNKTHMWFIEAAKDVVGINTATPSDEVELDINGSIATRFGGVVLGNGDNNNVDIGDNTSIRITGPTAAFAITGFSGVTDGRDLVVFNTTAQTLTIKNQNVASLVANRILTGVGAITIAGPGSCTFKYDAITNRWRVSAYVL